MSMLTRCPACGTSFRITTDQLVSRQGKVRCGNCQQVFSALGSLVHTRETPAHPPSDPVVPLDVGQGAAPAAASVPDPVGEETAQPAAAEAPVAPAETADTAAPETARVRRRRAVRESEDGVPVRTRRFAWLSFVGVLAAGTLLTAQAAYFYRDQLAVLQPETKPWLAQMCVELKCKIEMPADPQAIGIESSSLEADPADKTLMQLAALLRNRSSLAQNLPHLELTLLDAQETPVARRVFRPEEYAGRNPAPLAPDGEYQIKLSIDAGQLKANGYRVYAFYP
jgi:predicted Zn finger-like uncharacterized protein